MSIGAGSLLCFALVAMLIWASLPLARRIGLVASPGEHRRHAGMIPLTGGLAVSAGLGITLVVLGVHPGSGMLIGWLLLLGVGMLDDRFSLPYWMRFVVQIFAMLCLVWIDGVRLVDLGAVFTRETAGLGGWSTALTVFAGVGVINAINMVDGMDGLAGSLVVVCLGGLWHVLEPDSALALAFTILLIAAVAGFLLFNLRDLIAARVFFGDAGSMTLGYFLAWLLIANSQGSDRSFAPVLALWLLALPLFDAVGVLLRRPLRGLSPFHADWLHTHHLLLRCGLGINQSLGIIVAIGGALAALGIVLLKSGVAEHQAFYLFMTLFVIYLILMEWGDAVLRRRESKTGTEPSL